MNRSTSLEDSDAGGRGGKKKREKKGFKVDRYENYRQRFAKGINGKNIPKNNSGSVTKRVKAITFDEEDRREYLSLHKRKNERRVKAFVEAKQKTKRDNARTRRAQREEARQAYNKFAAVPILPNFTYRLPVEGCSDNEDDDEGHMDEGNEEMVQSRGINDAQKQRRLLAVEKTVHTMPATMSGGVLAESSIADAGCRLDDEFVTVEVKVLGSGKDSAGSGTCGSNSLPVNDFSDLPSVVEEELLRLKKVMKGPARTKSRVYMMKELEKIRKIKKHSRKGHGKKSAKGKRKNRRR
ncbi:hypothetical protein, conserved [Trypanosoma brucei gambiense DAL972]|uniref:Nucleolar protein 12 (25kDa) n=1 Tax=Trypanosoma brucei gambiense (strain MHOM/CI/86/DAL972) TaxID=679716 RepID=D0A1U3_TRYB9|nr:hypothetical protein, conserved [Trypanosoma brucei gambiense DAL972]CBH15236.1 hypothetical protein, conserved [Trypanosoma brucei gambiense DAL972]|eukprot:XP_011777501.1 hypothetical protein, conserved [Trypanosoma brucei gambiense DAL972]